MTAEKALIKADLIELFDSELVYAENPDIEYQHDFMRTMVVGLYFSVEPDGVLFIQFEQEEGIITKIWYRGHYAVTRQTPHRQIG